MTKRTLTKSEKNKKATEREPDKKQNKVILSITQVFRNLSISVNLTVYAIYLIYLIYSIMADVGIKIINIALASVTAAFMIVYLVLRLSAKRKGKQLKAIKHYYKNFKLIARTASALTAVYALVTAVSSVSPFAMIISFLGAVFLIIRLIVELILSLIRRKLRKVKDGIADKFKRGDTEPTDDDIDGEEEDSVDDSFKARMKRRRMKRRRRKLPGYRRTDDSDGADEEIVIPVDQCLLNDIDD